MKRKIENILGMITAIILAITLLIAFAVKSKAETITFQYITVAVNATVIQPKDEWQTVDSIRVKTLSNGMEFPDETGIFWAAMVNPFTIPVTYNVTVRGKFCIDGSCGIASLTGVMQTSKDGLLWILPPPSLTIKTDDGNIIQLSTITNSPIGRSWNSTIDLDVKGRLVTGIIPNAPVPEPATLALLGLGLAGIGSRLRKEKKE